MFTLFLGSLALAPAQAPAAAVPHDAQNPIYKGLLDPGLKTGPTLHVKFPTPTMPDGLDAAKQKAIITEMIGRDYSWAEFTRKSTVAPQLLKIGNASPSDPNAPARQIDVYFIVYGDLKSLDDEKFLDRMLNAGRGDGRSVTLKKEDLSKRKIEVNDEKREGYAFLDFDFLEKVRLKATGRGCWSRTADSALVAGEVDPRFVGDPEFPNQWQSLNKMSGAQKVGPASPWGGAGFYFKITRLHEPAGALFFEKHVIFTEPMGWFDGENLLRSKLPIVVQQNVRKVRAEWAKASTGK